MSTSVGTEPYLRHALRGRVRLHLPGWSGTGSNALEAALLEIDGVSSVHTNHLTGAVLVSFDASLTDAQTLLAATRKFARRGECTTGTVQLHSPERCPASSGRVRRSALGTISPLATARMPVGSSDAQIAHLRPSFTAITLKCVCILVNLLLADGAIGVLVAGIEALRLAADVLGHRTVDRSRVVNLGSIIQVSVSIRMTI